MNHTVFSDPNETATVGGRAMLAFLTDKVEGWNRGRRGDWDKGCPVGTPALIYPVNIRPEGGAKVYAWTGEWTPRWG